MKPYIVISMVLRNHIRIILEKETVYDYGCKLQQIMWKKKVGEIVLNEYIKMAWCTITIYHTPININTDPVTSIPPQMWYHHIGISLGDMG